MGNDGGSIPTRRELVKEAARNPTATQLKETLRERSSHLWTTCPLSHKSLTRPIVADSAGNLYNKDAVLQYLLPSDEAEEISRKEDCEKILQGRVKGLKDVVEVGFEVDEQAKTEGERWICPVTNKVLGPNVKAVYLVPCGHAFSEEAIREMKGEKCLQCNEPYTPENIIPILPSKSEDMERLNARSQRLAEQGLTHSLKKAVGAGKKRKKSGNHNGVHEVPATTNTTNVPEISLENGRNPHNLDPKAPSATGTPRTSTPQPNSGTSTPSGIKNPPTAMLTARVLEEENEKKKRRKLMGAGANENLKSLFTQGNGKGKDADFMTRGFSIPAGARR